MYTKGNSLILINDAEEAIRIVSRNSKEYNIDTKQVGIKYSSVGGLIYSTIAIHSEGDAKTYFSYIILFCHNFGSEFCKSFNEKFFRSIW